MKRILYVTGATGARHESELSYTLPIMRKYLGADNVLVTQGKRRGSVYNYVWTAFPLDNDLRERYDRVVWIDADVEVLSPAFADFGQLDIEGEAFGVLDPVPENGARTALLAKRATGVEIPYDRPYVNAGVLCLNIGEIDPEDWKRRLDFWRCADSFPYWDQSLLYCMCVARLAPPRFNVYWSLRDLYPDACAIHYNYAGKEPKRALHRLCGWS